MQSKFIQLLIKKALGRFVLPVLLMLGLFLQAMVPTGFMPSSQDGKIALVICSGMGDKTVLVDAGDFSASDRDHSDGKHDGSQSCPYFLAQLAGTHPEEISLTTYVFARDVPAQSPYQFVRSEHPNGLQAPRGPPALFVA